MTTRDPGKEDFADKELSQLYQSLAAPEVSAKTDEAILSFARQRNVAPPEPAKPKINWKGGFAVAASVVLVAVLSLTQMKPEHMTPLSDSAPVMEVASLSEPVALTDADAPGIVMAEEAVIPKNASARALPKISSIEILEQAPEQLIVTGSRKSENKTSADIYGSTSAILPECKLSLHGTYKLESTPLAKFILGWSDKNKQWLITQLNNNKTFQQAKSARTKADDIALLNKAGFRDAYKFTQSALETCRVQFGAPTR